MEQLLGVIVGPVLGTVGSIWTSKLKLKEKELDIQSEAAKFKHEVAMRAQEAIARHEAHEDDLEMNTAQTESELAKTVVKGSYEGLQASMAHDSSLKGGPIIDGLRASVRPVLTYGSIIAATTMAWYGVTGDVAEAASHSVITNASMAFAWWFGERQFTKLNGQYLQK